MEATINATVQKMDGSTQESKNLATTLESKPKDKILPFVDANIIESLVSLNDNHKALASTIGARLTAVTAEIPNDREIFNDDVVVPN